jgi:hypothetical protein
MSMANGHLFIGILLMPALMAFVAPRSAGQEVDGPIYVLEAGTGMKPYSGDVHKDSSSVSVSTSKYAKLILATGATLQGGDGWRIKHNIGVGAERQILSGVSVIGFIDYARFDYFQTQGFYPPYRKDPSYVLSVAAMLKVCFPWIVSPFVQAGVGFSYVNRGNLYYHDINPRPETDHVNGGGTVMTYLMNTMVGVEFILFKEFSLFMEGGFNGDWQKDRYPANALARFGIGVQF